MFPTLDVVHNLGYHEHIWAKYLETIIIIEEKLANDYFSDSLMETLREYIIRNDFSNSPDPNAYLKLSNRIRAIEFSILRTGEFPIPSIIDAVNFTRTSNKDLFQNWKQSDTDEATMRCLKMALLSKVKTSLKTLPRLPCVVLQNDPKGIVKV